MGIVDSSSIYCYVAGKHGEAEQVYRNLADVQQKLLGKKHPDTISAQNKLATCLWNQAVYLWNKDKYTAALPNFQSVADIRADILGNDHPDSKKAYEMVSKCKQLLR